MRKTPLRSRSLKLQRAMTIYRREVRAFLTEHDRCEFPLGCDKPSTVCHHKRGRFGRRLLDKRYWAGSCSFHNDFAETHTGEALACGWLIRIEAVDA